MNRALHKMTDAERAKWLNTYRADVEWLEAHNRAVQNFRPFPDMGQVDDADMERIDRVIREVQAQRRAPEGAVVAYILIFAAASVSLAIAAWLGGVL